MNSVEEYAGYYASTAVEKVASEALGTQYRGQTSSASWQEVYDYIGKLTPTQRWLDLGCGRGAFSVAIAREGCRVTGVDVETDLVAAAVQWSAAAEVSERCTFLVQDFTDLTQFSSSPFDGAICIGSLYWSQDIRRLLSQWRKILKLGAPLIVFTNCGAGSAVHKANADLLGTQYIDQDSLFRALHDAGFCLDLYENDSENYKSWLNRWCLAMKRQKDELEKSMGQTNTEKFFRRFYAYQDLASRGHTRRLKIKASAC